MGMVLLALAALLVGITQTARADAGTIVVTNGNDSGQGSLRDAIATAPAGAHVIVPAGMYMLTTDEIRISENLTISGAGAATTTIQAQTAPPTNPQLAFRVFHTIGAGNQITISGVTITGGRTLPVGLDPNGGGGDANGAGVLNEGATLTLSDDVIRDNTAFADSANAGDNGGSGAHASGGGVYNTGILNLVDTSVLSNTATASGSTGRGGVAHGGGVFSDGTLEMRGSTLAGNTADAFGGHLGTVGSEGGGTSRGGGLMATASGPTTISDSTFNNNVASGSVIDTGAPGGSGGGGGVFLDNGTGAISETNVTVTRNLTTAMGGVAFAGGILLTGRTAGQSLTNATVVGNVVTGSDANSGGNLLVLAGDAATIRNSIIAAGQADPGTENCDVIGVLSSLGHNIDSHDQCNFHTSGDLVNKDPLLAPLANYGGPVETAALNPGSPAIDAGAADVCPSTDARGALRPAGSGCDIGAFEVASPNATTGQASSLTTSSAVLGGLASNSDLGAGTAFFEYGTTAAYGNSTAPQPVVAATRVQVSAPLTGLSAATKYHFRIVVRNALGTVNGADRTFTTASPVTSPPPVFHPPRLAVRSVAIAGATATVVIACDGSAGGRCAGTVRGTVQERVRGGSIVSVSANAAKRASVKTRTVTVVSGAYGVQTGQRATVRVTANAAGKRLLAGFYRMPTRLAFAGPPQVARTVTFAYPRITALPVNYWLYKNPPCGLCVTLVQQLIAPDLPSGARVAVSCVGMGCPFTRRLFRPRHRTLPLTGLFAHSQLGPGTRVEILITAPNRVGEAQFYTTRAGTFPLAATRCLPPGVRVPVACRPGA